MSRAWSNDASLTRAYPESAGHVHGSATSRAAADAINLKVESLEDVVRSLLRIAGKDGLTDFELQSKAEREGIYSLLRPRRAQMKERGEIVAAGKKRPSPVSGLLVEVWTLA